MKHKLFLSCSVLLSVFGNSNWYLPEPIVVRTSPLTLFEIHGLCVSAKKQLYIMDSEGNWNELELNDLNAEIMINAIHDRVTKIFHSKLREVA